jgi:hypothetical protein
MNAAHAIRLTLLATALAACSPVRLKVPEAANAGKELKVQGFSANSFSFKQKDIQLGSYRVTNIDRDWDKGSTTNVGNGAYARDEKTKGFRFDVKAQARTLHAECNEEAVQQGILGFTDPKIILECTCTEGETTRATLKLKNGKGNANVGAAAYDLSALHRGEGGADASEALGYQFRGAQGTGVVDVSSSGRAWLPAAASEDEALGLVCGYAGFLLYRPTKF